jgi:hypothetical protein
MVLAAIQAAKLDGPATQPVAGDPYALRKFGARRKLGRALDPRDPRVAHEAAALLTSQLFFAPLLAEMRKLPFGKQIGHGGRAEEVFGEQLDQRIADAVARSDGSLTAQLAERLARGPQAQRGQQAAAARIPAESRSAVEQNED